MSDFNKYDAKEYALELLEEHADALTSTAILAFLNLSELEAVEQWASDNNCIDSEEALSEHFDAYLSDIQLDYGDDYTAFCEDFNNTTDAWCEDGLIHSEQYNVYVYKGKHFRSERFVAYAKAR
jgi:hypothetical protein